MEGHPFLSPFFNQMSKSTHPVEIALAIVLASVESLIWLINEIAGFHKAPATAPVTAPAPAPVTIAYKPAKITAAPVPTNLTKRQLQALTGIKSSRYNKAALLKIATEKNLIK